jgi:hypothetical protein
MIRQWEGTAVVTQTLCIHCSADDRGDIAAAKREPPPPWMAQWQGSGALGASARLPTSAEAILRYCVRMPQSAITPSPGEDPLDMTYGRIPVTRTCQEHRGHPIGRQWHASRVPSSVCGMLRAGAHLKDQANYLQATMGVIASQFATVYELSVT